MHRADDHHHHPAPSAAAAAPSAPDPLGAPAAAPGSSGEVELGETRTETRTSGRVPAVLISGPPPGIGGAKRHSGVPSSTGTPGDATPPFGASGNKGPQGGVPKAMKELVQKLPGVLNAARIDRGSAGSQKKGGEGGGGGEGSGPEPGAGPLSTGDLEEGPAPMPVGAPRPHVKKRVGSESKQD
jgi:hypothetical protein